MTTTKFVSSNKTEQNCFFNFKDLLIESAKKYGGPVNLHAHLDRGYTFDEKYFEHAGIVPIEASTYPLAIKQHMTGYLHTGSAYSKESLGERMQHQLEESAKLGIGEIWSAIDTTADIGLDAIEVALKLKGKFSGKIDFKVGAYDIFGLKPDEPEREKVFLEGVKMADFIVSLPERDKREGHIGYKPHFRKHLEWSMQYKKPIHFHVDQEPSVSDNDVGGTETLINLVEFYKDARKEIPEVWAVHAITPSAYGEERFRKLVDGLARNKIGVLCCPSAGISMYQNRSVMTPTHNSIARVLEMMLAGVDVAIGSDNNADIFVPTRTLDLYEETTVLANTVRFYNPSIWAKVLTRTALNEMDKELVRRALTVEKEY